MSGFVVVTKKLDPLEKFQKARPSDLIEAMGLIPYFVVEAATEGPEGAAGVLEAMNNAYGFAIGGNMTGGTVSEEGVYQYPEDPDLYPYARFTLSGPDGDIADVFVYPYAIVAVRDNKETLVTRMD